MGARAAAHIRYIQGRPGEDLDRQSRSPQWTDGIEGAGVRHQLRPLHVGGEENHLPGKGSQEFKEAVLDPNARGSAIHKFVLSPSAQNLNINVDMAAYTRYMMDTLGRARGQDLQYAFAVHENTDNPHSHVVTLGKDREGNQVRFDRSDYARMRAYGDRYLEREHGVEMQFGRDIEMFARLHGHNLYASSREENQAFLERPLAERSWQPDEDFRHFLNINRNWAESLDGPSREGGLSLGDTWMHDRGRLSPEHDLFQNAHDKGVWQDVFDNTGDADLKEYAAAQLESLESQRRDTLGEIQQQTGLTPDNIDRLFEDIRDQFADEWLSIDQALYPERYEPAMYERGNIDLDRVEEQDKVTLSDGTGLTKYDSSEYLNHVRQRTHDLGIPVDSDDFSRICTWLGTKAREGEDCYGEPPLRPFDFRRNDIDLDQVSDRDKIEMSDGSFISKYDTTEFLQNIREQLQNGHYSERLEAEDYAQLNEWIDTKEERGEQCYGRPPLNSVDRADGPLDLGALQSAIEEESRNRADMLAPHARDNPDLAELDPVVKMHTISIDDALDARGHESAEQRDLQEVPPLAPNLEINDVRSIEDSIEHGEREPERNYDEPYDIHTDETPLQPDMDFDSRAEFDHSQDHDTREFEPALDVDQNGGDGYDIDHDEDKAGRGGRDDDDDEHAREHSRGDRGT